MVHIQAIMLFILLTMLLMVDDELLITSYIMAIHEDETVSQC